MDDGITCVEVRKESVVPRTQAVYLGPLLFTLKGCPGHALWQLSMHLRHIALACADQEGAQRKEVGLRPNSEHAEWGNGLLIAIADEVHFTDLQNSMHVSLTWGIRLSCWGGGGMKDMHQ